MFGTKKRKTTRRKAPSLSKRQMRNKKRRVSTGLSLKFILAVGVLVFVIALLGIGFVFLDKYVEQNVPVSEKTGTLKLANAPVWVNEALRGKIYAAAVAGGEDLKLDDDVAQSVQQNIAAHFVWLDAVTVQANNADIIIRGRWRKPIATIKLGVRTFYTDSELVVLDFVPLSELPTVRVRGLTVTTTSPQAGWAWDEPDLEAAVELLGRLQRMDELVTPEKPLFNEIEIIDVANFNGRQSRSAAHIVLYAKDKTEILWGCEIGTWQRYLEATDQEKLAKLYSYYKEHGTLLDGAKYINLRDPRQRIHLPGDEY